MLILEGAGRLGKTTAAKRIVELVQGSQYRHMGRPIVGTDFFHSGQPIEKWDWFMDYIPYMRRNYVQDRFHWGALAWHGLRETGMTPIRQQILDSWVHAIGGMIVVFVSDNEDWYRRHWTETRRGNETFDNSGPHIEANRRFQHLRPHADACWRVNSPSDFVPDKVIREWIKEWQLRQELTKW